MARSSARAFPDHGRRSSGSSISRRCAPSSSSRTASTTIRRCALIEDERGTTSRCSFSSTPSPTTFRGTSATGPAMTPEWRDLGNEPEVDEYIRRQTMSAHDYKEFIARLKRDFPDESFLVVRFGDHQPSFSPADRRAAARRCRDRAAPGGARSALFHDLLCHRCGQLRAGTTCRRRSTRSRRPICRW